jgi:hypothetical protein
MKLSRAAFAVWFAASLVLGVLMLMRHAVALPATPRTDARLGNGLAALREPGDENRWMAVHVLYSACQCSQRIVDHLAASERPAGVRETVVLVGSAENAPRLVAHGFRVRSMTPPQLAEQLHVEGAPLFLLVDPAGQVRYSGGYTTTKQGADVRDLAIMNDVMGGASVTPLALLGCAVSDRLKKWLRPLEIL